MSERARKRQQIKEIYQNLDDQDLIYIPAKKELQDTVETPKKRVAAYCRVSTDDPAQTTSYEIQKEHYEEEINKNPDWIFAGIYADEGISATSTKHRDNFKRMIADCEAGKIDLIITKAVSRFARNVVDCLSLSRKLAALPHPVGIFFETEGINTLDSTSEMILVVMAAAAQEESKTKSNSMIWSLSKRFKKGKFLTPVLLGYDHDEEGKLVINDEEAQTVRLIYYLYLSGIPTTTIAEILTLTERKTKLGNTKWSSGTVRDIMRNERHCGNVLSWKTYTYDFWEHKKRKNYQDRPQVLKVDHHEAIVSHEIYDAAQLKLESDRFLQKGIGLPALEVVDDGVLKGFVRVNRMWSGFSANDYREASESVYDSDVGNPGENSDVSDIGGFSLDGYEIVKSIFFSPGNKPAMTIAKGHVRFNSECMKKFEAVEYIELLYNSVEKCIAVRPCDKDNPNAIRWGSLKDSRWIVSPKSCSGFANALYTAMDWKADCGYRLQGQYVADEEGQVLFFDLSDPEITQYVAVNEDEEETARLQDALQSARDAAENAAECKNEINAENTADAEPFVFDRKKKYMAVPIIPESWNAFYGRGSTATTVIELRLEDYRDNWMVMKPATTFRLCGNISEDTMIKVRSEAKALLSGFIKGNEEVLAVNGDLCGLV